MVFDNNYFNDRYQGIPVGGYNRLVSRLLENTDCLTSTDFFSSAFGSSDDTVSSAGLGSATGVSSLFFSSSAFFLNIVAFS